MANDQEAFRQSAERYRRELQLHCYRMVGSYHDAEDLVQETLLRAWRGLDGFDGRASLRTWLYRIATNTCLNALSSRVHGRVMPDTQGPPSDRMPDREPASDVEWLEPYPDAALDGIADVAPGPDARYEMREAVQLAFIAAIHHLPPRQRAALLLRDVLGWSASESAELLESSVASLNSALQRARAIVETRLRRQREDAFPEPSNEQRAVLERYIRAWETSDVDAFASTLRDDTIFTMPPWRQWYFGRDAIRRFFSGTIRPDGPAPFRLVATGANRQPAFAFYSRRQGPEWRFHSVQLLVLEGMTIATMTSFVTPTLARVFDLPEILPD